MQINEEDAQPDPQHSVPDLDFNIKIVDDEKKVNQISSATVGVSNQQANQSAIEPMQTNRPRCLVQLFHCLFKGIAILFFFLLNMVIQDETITFVLIVIFDAFDFWTVKNISGRKLVGLRWWSEIKEDGVEVWQYESMQANFEPNECNSSVFWFSQVISVIVWLVLTLVYLISFHWFWALLCITGVILCGLNLFGFYKCRGQHQKKAKLYMAKIGLKALQGSM